VKFLTRLGQILLQASTGLQIGAPIVKQFTPDNVDRAIDKAVDTTTKLSGIATQVEVMGQVLNLSGVDKLKAAVPLAAQVFLASDALKGHKVKDPALFMAGVEKCMSGYADVMNSLDDDSLKS